MKLETFFDKFDQFADAPNAAAKLRDLVLRLAVTGRLVEPDSRDSPASELLASVAAQRASLVSARKIKARPSLPVTTDAKPFELPPSWEWARLADVGYELGQKIPDTRFTYIDVGSIDSIKGRISVRVEQLEPNEAPSRARKIVARGTVIYSTVRPYLLNIAIVDQDLDPEPIASTAFGILHPFAGIDNRYLYYWLRSAPFTAYVQEGMKGMAYPAINDEKFYSGFIAVPPSAEQKRIVAKVDESMALCDRLEAQQQEREIRHVALSRASLARFADAPTQANLHHLFHPSYTIPPADLRKTILTLAFQGRLVAEQVGALPWTTRRLKDLTTKIGSGSTPLGGKESYKPEGTPLIRSMNVHFGKFVRDGLVFIDDQQAAKLNHVIVEVDDILLNITGASIGRVTVAPDDMAGARVNQHVAIVRSNGELLPRFLQLFLASPTVQDMIDEVQVGATREALTKGMIERFEVPVPALSAQLHLVERVDHLMALVDELEMQFTASNATAGKLMEAVVAKLTAQD